jgi:peroxiredoxin Q/BCP
LKVGDRAPDFSLPDQSGNLVDFRDLVGKSCIVLYFYPGDFTPGCTAEACSFRDHYDAFVEKGAKVVGISSDPPKKHDEFMLAYNLPFLLLSDEKDKVRDLFGVPPSLKRFPGRVTYIIDKNGKVRHIFSSQLRPKKHVDIALDILEKLPCNPE